MGLDAVEIVMNVEDHFGITIQNTEAEHVRTVADLVTLIHGRIAVAHESYCPTLPAFLKLRTNVRDAIGDHTYRIRPRQRIVDRLTVTQRRQLWNRLSEMLGSPPRGLRRPRLLRQLLGISVVTLLGIALIAAVAIDLRILPVTLVVAAFCIFLLHIVTVPFRTVPPAEWVTFGDITTKIVSVTSATKQLQLRTADDVLCELRPLIVDVLGVDIDEVVPDARFVEDLGVG
ncbi:acyl carrier protein [Roseimaritima multifibrata]|uniref:Acyl carrier protein n=1 Tax=Roseimaritima multifibrata TaxID=1930274 RepID=A0A517MJV3_9BACT|nr:acyl carrier protein [Roseimaritima multifibrata]QDS95120.1 acyl carrier protein [Roseimaritima multifibrata]